MYYMNFHYIYYFYIIFNLPGVLWQQHVRTDEVNVRPYFFITKSTDRLIEFHLNITRVFDFNGTIQTMV